jgi:iron complex outermembrane receptor protein
VIINASDVEVYGAELEADASPWEGSLFQVRFGWLESQFLDFIQVQTVQGNSVPGESVAFDIEVDNSGNRLLNSPKYTVSITARQEIPLAQYGTAIVRYDGSWKDETFYDGTAGVGVPNPQTPEATYIPSPGLGQKAYWLHNVRLAYRTPNEQIEVAGWVRNLTDEVYKTYAIDAGAFLGSTLFFLGEPRTYGVTVSVGF